MIGKKMFHSFKVDIRDFDGTKIATIKDNDVKSITKKFKNILKEKFG